MIDPTSPDYNAHPGRTLQSGKDYLRAGGARGLPAVSILTPYYNTEPLFEETLRSIQAQTLQNWEWIITDDGSTDPDSVERLTSLAAKDSRISVMRQENAGPSAARNTSFRHSQAPYVCLLDSDDMVEPTYLEKMIWFLESNPEFAFCNAHNVVFGDQQHLWTVGFERGVEHLRSNSGPPISVVRRTAFAACGGFDETIRFGHEDWDFWLAMAKAGLWGYTIPEYLQWYRKRGNGRFEQIMRSGDVNAKFEALMREKYDGLESKFPKPERRTQQPYDAVSADIPFNNELEALGGSRHFLFLIPWMVTGGADRVNLDLIEGLVTRGHLVTVCATLSADHRWLHLFNQWTTDIFILPNILHPSDFPRFILYLIKSRHVDTILISGSTVGYQLLPFLRSHAPGVCYLDMCHVEEPHWLNGGHPRFGAGYQDHLDLNIVTTAHLAGWMQSKGAQPERIELMYTGIRSAPALANETEHQAIRDHFKVPAGVPLIVFAGRLCEQKRPLLLARILSEARQNGAIFYAVIVGEGELKESLSSSLKHNGMNDVVHLAGTATHTQWLELLSVADILLMPSQYEGISVALLEAMASGVIPLVADVGGQAELLPPQAGFLIQQTEHECDAYVQALLQLLKDPQLRLTMSKACKQTADTKLSWSGMIDRFEAIVTRAHQLHAEAPRQLVSPRLGIELATLAIEYRRLSDVADWLWRSRDTRYATSNSGSLSAWEMQAIGRFALAVSELQIVRFLIRQRWIRAVARWFVSKISIQKAA